MNGFLQENLEDYLSGRLSGERRKQFERCLEDDPRSAAKIAAMTDNALLFESLRLPEGELPPVPAPGFYARVRQQIDEERETPFWEVFLEPFILRRIAVAACVWLLAVGTVSFYNGSAGLRHERMAESILAKPPAVADYYVRLGSDLDMNRDTMLSAVLISSR